MAYVTKKQKRRQFIVPTLIFLLLALVLLYKLGMGKPYIVKLSVYKNSDKVYIITSDCIKQKLDKYANDSRDFVSEIAGVDKAKDQDEIHASCESGETTLQ